MSRGFIDGEYQDGELRGLTLCLGVRGSGKTTEMGRLMNECTGGVLFFDPLSKHASLLPGAIIIGQPAPLAEYLRPNRGRRFRVIYQPRSGNLDQHFRDVCRIVQAFGWMIFGVDEIDKVCGARYSPAYMPPELYDLVNYGRHHRVSMIAAARRPTSVPPGYRDEAELRVFTLKRDVAERIEGDIGKDAVEQVVKLPKFYYMRFALDADPILCGGPRGAL